MTSLLRVQVLGKTAFSSTRDGYRITVELMPSGQVRFTFSNFSIYWNPQRERFSLTLLRTLIDRGWHHRALIQLLEVVKYQMLRNVGSVVFFEPILGMI